MGAKSRLVGVLAGASLVVAGVVATIRWMNGWGATADERSRTYPGDELVAGPAGTSAMAVPVRAPAARVWPWLVQIGADRGGMYSYDWLENLIGLDIHSATEIREEWQHLAPGDSVWLVRPGWAGLAEGYAMRVARVEAPHLLVLRQGPSEHPWDGVWTFVVEPTGEDSCRLIAHARTRRSPGAGGRALDAATSLGTPVTWLMTRKMLHTIARRAEEWGPPVRRI